MKISYKYLLKIKLLLKPFSKKQKYILMHT